MYGIFFVDVGKVEYWRTNLHRITQKVFSDDDYSYPRGSYVFLCPTNDASKLQEFLNVTLASFYLNGNITFDTSTCFVIILEDISQTIGTSFELGM